MTVKDFILSVLDNAEMNQAEFAGMLGVDRRSVYTTLSRKEGMGMKVETLIKWAEELDYQVVLQSADGEQEFVLDGEVEDSR